MQGPGGCQALSYTPLRMIGKCCQAGNSCRGEGAPAGRFDLSQMLGKQFIVHSPHRPRSPNRRLLRRRLHKTVAWVRHESRKNRF